MNSILPNAGAFKKQVQSYVADTRNIVETCITTAEASAPFTHIYKISLATHTILGSLSSSKLTPSLAAARAISVRIPLLVLIGQSSAALTELRRFLELTLWTIYFSDHPVEWKEFSGGTGGFTRDTRAPIAYAARREVSYYLAYAKELMVLEPSGIASKALLELDGVRQALNSSVHAGRIARSAGRIPPYDSVADKDLEAFGKLQRTTFASCCVVLGAYRRSKFDKMTAVSRAYFDFLVGSTMRKEIRSGPFGLP